ncbi:zinc finger protein 2 isoform X2 [Drosophila subobscura]|uniref:zinc finger protein 2 isoform X2 n=1 Tax=Drosophila subobscura TaxID=7241 RepID=UPI00155A6711|nr:zinc finger protein 2 isoform X2 [Drosophila subobscura]
MSSSDVETFKGKIVYNIDGSAYIIDADNANGCESVSVSLQSSDASTSTLVKRPPKTKDRRPEKEEDQQPQEQKHKQEEDQDDADAEAEADAGGAPAGGFGYKSSPKIHSFRVVSAQDANTTCPDPNGALNIQKPILMCFICKLSFGNVKSFSLHANTEHRLNLEELEQQLLNREYSSAIIQRNMDEKPQISFLQPLDINATCAVEKLILATDAHCTPLASESEVSHDLYEHENDRGQEKGVAQEKEQDSEHNQDQDQDQDRDRDQDQDHANRKRMAAPSANLASSSTKVAAKSVTVKFGSLNSATAKTNNLSKVSSSSSPAYASATVVEGEVPLPSTDNISKNKSTNCRQGIEPPTTSYGYLNDAKSQSPTASVCTSPQPNESDTAGADFLQLQQVAAAVSIFPPEVSSFHASLAALAANEPNANRVKLLTEFLQQQLQQQQQQQQQQQSSLFPSLCPDHPDFKGVDCKTCELIDIQQRVKSPPPSHQNQHQHLSLAQSQSQPQPHRSPNSNSGGLAISPSSSSVASVGNASGAASSFTIGACSEHINGRPQGIDCARCEMLLNSARLNSGVQMSTRNSCKTLKCPQCNWHYKYQETLEIHMREKHPDGESACGYCLAGQQHPRLARGESYSCGYKPYRCEICNYSTTTKGNLSIHMQSDKHLNNMQELNSSQNMVAAAAAAAASGKLLLSSSSTQASAASQQTVLGSSASASTAVISNSVGGNSAMGATPTPGCTGVAVASGCGSVKPKPSFRCDICSYETSVARNLRIHMTSEKHTHNMAVLQNNIKHIQAFNFLQQQQQQQQGAGGSTSGSSASGSFMPEVALADLAYNQALMIQLLHQQQQQQPSNAKMSPTSSSPVSSTDQFSFSPKAMKHGHGMGMGLGMPMGIGHSNEASGESGSDAHPLAKPDMWPTALYSCLICDSFSTNNLDDLNQHLLVDRSRQSSSASADIMVIHNNNYICRLCNYKTNLKANFQLHSKTDKHLQKLNFINHIREGGARNEYKLQYQPQLTANVVQLMCNCCDFHTNSIQKLSMHTQQMRHDTMRMIFQHLLYITQQSRMHKESPSCTVSDDALCPCPDEDQQSITTIEKVLICQLCSYAAKNLYEMVQHVKGIRHMQVEQFICLQRRSENQEMPGLNEVYKVTERIRGSEDIIFEAGFNIATTAPVGGSSDVGSAAATAGCSVAAAADSNILSPKSTSSCSTSCGKSIGRTASPSINDFSLSASSSIPTTVFKCNLCEYFVQSKKDVASHIESVHPGAEGDDFMSIPTNTAALQAFQTAVAAAALAAVQQRCSAIHMPREADTDMDPCISDCPIDIKRERLEVDDDPMTGIEDKKSTASLNEEAPKSSATNTTPTAPTGVQCPLCLENGFREKKLLETHLTGVHSVTKDGLSRLLQLVDSKAWSVATDFPSLTATSSITSHCTSKLEDCATTTGSVNTEDCESNRIPAAAAAISTASSAGMQGLSCQQCEAIFKHEEQLLQHAQQTQHFPEQNGEYICLASSHISRPCFMSFSALSAMITHFKDSHMSLVISERHVYKYRCKQCSLAFKTQEKLTTHMLYHTMRDATKCSLCHRNFRSTQALQKHMEQTHSNDGPETGVAAGSTSTNSPGPPTPTQSYCEIGKLSSGEREPPMASNPGPKSNDTSRRSLSPLRLEMKYTKETAQLSPCPSPHNLDAIQTQQQQHEHMATLTAALLKQQQQQCHPEAGLLSVDPLSFSAADFAQQLQVVPPQSQLGAFGVAGINQQSLQGLQNLQNLQHMQQQFSAVAASSGMPINPVDMLNLMQFHHLMSLNFMNLAPPLIFGANTATGNKTSTAGAQNNGMTSSSLSAPASQTPDMQIGSGVCNLTGESSNANNPTAQHSVNSNSQMNNNQKRARTRITDDQLKILRAHFDINNSPSEESIMEMSQKANLPMKVVKHWFRNTLFKERQRNKDSPYNFNNPPSTTLNLEEYERTGQTKVTPLNDIVSSATPATIPTSSAVLSAPSGNANSKENTNATVSAPAILPAPVSGSASRPASTNSSGNISDYLSSNLCFGQQESKEQSQPCPVEVQIKSEPQDETIVSSELAFLRKQQQQQQGFHFFKHQQQQQGDPPEQSQLQDPDTLQDQSLLGGASLAVHCHNQQQLQQQQQAQTNSCETKSESGSSDVMSRPPTPNSVAASNLYGSMNDLLSHQLENMGSNMGPPKKMQIAGKTFDKGTAPVSSSATACNQFESNSSSSSNSSSTSGGKRANRTRFTDYQIKVLQEFFENNSYPKDSDLEYLSKLLLLSPRVIVVWFQNARQKQRKIYENQPNNSLFENEETKKQNINYACKKCSLVFQRYYELIRHQKNHCFKEENNKKSAKAQIAAAQIAQNLSSEDSNSSLDIHHAGICPPGPMGPLGSQIISAAPVSIVTPSTHAGSQPFGASPSPQHIFSKSSSLTDFSPSTTPTPPQRERSNSLDQPHRTASKFDCDKCDMQFIHLELLREHQMMHLMNPTALLAAAGQHPNPDASYGPFGSILQSLHNAAAHQQQHQQPPTKKRKYSDSSSNADDVTSVGEMETPQKKYEFLYQYFMQHETNSELKQQFLMQHQQQQQQQKGNETDFELEFLTNFYQQSELKNVSNYDFLLQYYRKSEEISLNTKSPQQTFSSSKKPTIEFLLQYYQLNESKKFFQLVASPQTMPDGQGYQPSSQLPNATADETMNVIGEPEEGQKLQDQSQNNQEHSNVGRKRLGKADLAGDDKKEQEKLNNNSITINSSSSESAQFTPVRVEACETQSIEIRDHQQPAVTPTLMSITEDEKSLFGRSPQKNDKEKSQFFQNLEDFLDATMIENNSQTLTFNDDDTARQKDDAKISSNHKVHENVNSVSPVNAPSKQNKRLRTTILPEQLNFLYECYQSESNPSRKMLEEISKKVNLKKRVVQVWFQNSRAKDKKSRNQRHYSHISDDNSYDGSSGKEVGNDMKGKCVSVVQDHDMDLQDCQLCQVTQVNMQKHAFSVEHICKMKELLEQTTELYANSNGSGSDDNDSDREKRFYNLSKAFLLQHVVSNAASISTQRHAPGAGTGPDTDVLPEKNCLLNFDAASCESKGHIKHHSASDVGSKDVQNVGGNQDLMQQLFNRNHITVIGGK